MFTLDTDVLLAIDTLSAEKRISKNTIFEAIEGAFKKELSKYYPVDGEFVVKMDQQNGSISFYEKKFVVSADKIGQGEISITEARRIEPNVEEGGCILLSLPKLDSTLMPISALRRGVLNAIKVAQKEAEYNEFKKREGELITVSMIIRLVIKFVHILKQWSDRIKICVKLFYQERITIF